MKRRRANSHSVAHPSFISVALHVYILYVKTIVGRKWIGKSKIKRLNLYVFKCLVSLSSRGYQRRALIVNNKLINIARRIGQAILAHNINNALRADIRKILFYIFFSKIVDRI